ncbi:MAG: hypothetical protein OM95_04530 [Bdellovibrio sp. ArHS]|uniref:J domain-containing protein n=1 Tax=Bdellovibrio sp. ArHS TaxID=1569284 RepID=UPI000582F37C|nr:J domain-containing protein [Bdellovibrio sp. ArHS]KHD89104.1 MAG: hypothetical protein OM95_04530 [Bdellovibrio sp. ArHS]
MKIIFFFVLIWSSLSYGDEFSAQIDRLRNSKTFYDLLEVSPQATDDEIRKAYRRMARIFHPDLHATDPTRSRISTDVMQKLNRSREVLTDPVAKRNYDSTLRNKPSQNTRSQSSSSSAGKGTSYSYSSSSSSSSSSRQSSERPYNFEDFDTSSKGTSGTSSKWTPPEFEEPSVNPHKKSEGWGTWERGQEKAWNPQEFSDAEEPKGRSSSSGQNRSQTSPNSESSYRETSQRSSAAGPTESPRTSTTSAPEPDMPRTQAGSSYSPGARQAKKATDLYENVSRCGRGFYKSVIDTMM